MPRAVLGHGPQGSRRREGAVRDAVPLRRRSNPAQEEAETDALAAPVDAAELSTTRADVAAEDASSAEGEPRAQAAERQGRRGLRRVPRRIAQRTQADFENYRKRVARELGQGAQIRGVSARLARELLPALDSARARRSKAQPPADADEPAARTVAAARLQRELLGALERAGVEPYGAAGRAVRPRAARGRRAAAHADGACASGEIVEVYQSGYRLAGGVIRSRHARVVVAG